MEYSTATGNMTINRYSPLVNSIAKLRSEYSNIQNELRHVYDENNRLKNELEKSRSRHSGIPSLDLSSLRRRIAFLCHPDRGGDAELMKELNILLDFLAAIKN